MYRSQGSQFCTTVCWVLHFPSQLAGEIYINSYIYGLHIHDYIYTWTVMKILALEQKKRRKILENHWLSYLYFNFIYKNICSIHVTYQPAIYGSFCLSPHLFNKNWTRFTIHILAVTVYICQAPCYEKHTDILMILSLYLYYNKGKEIIIVIKYRWILYYMCIFFHNLY